jgi:acyl-CoA-binding protein
MATGIEDLHEKNKGETELKQDSRYDSWRTFQGREDAEMLQEKSAGWSSKKASRGEYDSWEDD